MNSVLKYILSILWENTKSGCVKTLLSYSLLRNFKLKARSFPLVFRFKESQISKTHPLISDKFEFLKQ